MTAPPGAERGPRAGAGDDRGGLAPHRRAVTAGRRSRLHPLTMVSGTARDVAGILLAGATGLAAAGPATGAWFALIGWGIGFGHQLVRWWTFTYTVHDERLELRRSFIGRSVTSIPLDRIRGVDISASPQHRLLRLAVVHIDAAAGGAGDEGRLDAVSRADAERLRARLLGDTDGERDRGGAFAPAAPPRAGGTRGPAGPPPGTVPGSGTGGPDRHPGTGGRPPPAARSEIVLARARPRWYLYAPLSGAYLLTPFALLGVLYNLGDDLGLVGERSMERIAGDAAQIGPALVAAALLACALAMPLASVVVFAVFNWDFTLRSVVRPVAPRAAVAGGAGGELVAERGLGTRRSVSLERRRIRGVELRDNPLERLAGVVRLGAVVTGLGDSEHRGRLLPTAPRDVAIEVAAKVLGGVPAPLIAHPRAARSRRVVRAAMPQLVVAAIALFAGRPWVVAVCLAAAAGAVPLGLDRYRQLGHATDEARLSVRSGALRRRHAVVEHRAVVSWCVRQSFFQRRLGLATLVAAVGAGDGAYPVVDMAASEVIDLAGRITPDWVLPFIETPPPSA